MWGKKQMPGVVGAAVVGTAALSSPAYAQTAERADWKTDYRVPGVRIFAGPTASSAVLGLGYPGDGIIHHGTGGDEAYTCDNGSITTGWSDGTNARTGVRGWVPICNVRVFP